ncbi:DOUBLE-STRANDED RNA-BINDING PROTEIN 4 [Salix purpurea]|uniref:DOUBLE-STRANDED RNA-BINDING PROTEIN 4 n=1 Tax=Salix purpurea TaxID=77065 RepID=A0A9Q0URQ6_SALPP|nr:DOUBLE-STRANDED RNA-BINDING PROTEIN 4 [Salix purpurea]
MYKNRLQEYTQKSSLQLPVYQTFNEGPAHMPRFRSTVWVDGAQYTSQKTFLHRKAAEQDAANLALESILKRVKDEECPLLDAETVFCKSILNEFAVKVNREKPTYNSVQLPGPLPIFTSTLVFDGSKSKLQAALDRVRDSNHFKPNIVPVGVKVGHCSETTVDQEQVVSTAVARDAVPASAIPPAASGMHRPHHDFKRPRLDPDPAPKPIPFPIAFEHPVSEQPLGADYGSSSAKKRWKDNKNANEETDTQ